MFTSLKAIWNVLFSSDRLNRTKEYCVASPHPPTPLGFRLNISPDPAVSIELFQDVCCPFSKRMFNTIVEELIPMLNDKELIHRICFIWQSVPQPWHAQSCLMHEAIIAAYLTNKHKIVDYLQSLYYQQDNFFDEKTKDLSRVELYARLANIGVQCGYEPGTISSKLNLEGVKGNSGLIGITQHLKWAVKYHRMRGVHVTPTVFINGLEAVDISSDWSLRDWRKKLEPMLNQWKIHQAT